MIKTAAALLYCALLYSTFAPSGSFAASSAPTVVPTPTWTAAQEKAYHRRLEAYRKFGYKTPPKDMVYICAFCGHKSHTKGLCPKCGFEMTPYDPKAKTHQKVYSPDSM